MRPCRREPLCRADDVLIVGVEPSTSTSWRTFARTVQSTPGVAPSATKPRRRRYRNPPRPVRKNPNRRTRTALLFGVIDRMPHQIGQRP